MSERKEDVKECAAGGGAKKNGEGGRERETRARDKKAEKTGEKRRELLDVRLMGSLSRSRSFSLASLWLRLGYLDTHNPFSSTLDAAAPGLLFNLPDCGTG